MLDIPAEGAAYKGCGGRRRFLALLVVILL